MLQYRPIITHSKDTLSDNYIIKVPTTNIIVALKHNNLLNIKLKIMQKDTIEGSLIEDVTQYYMMSSSMLKYTLLNRIHIDRENIPFEVLMQLLVP